MSFSRTAVGEHGAVLCPSRCKNSFLALLREDFAFALMAEIQTEGPFFEPPLYGNGEQSGRKRQRQKYLPHAIFWRKLLTGLSLL